MLVTRGTIQVGGVVYSSTLAFERRFRVYLEDRTETIWDTRFVRPRTNEGGGRAVVYAIVEGWHEWHAHPIGALHGPAVFVASQGVVDGLRGPALERTAGGRRCRSVQLRLLDGPDLPDERPRRIEGSKAITDAAKVILDFDRDDLRAPIAAFLEACADAGVAPRGLAATMTRQESRNVTRMWSALRAGHLLVERFPALQRVGDAAGLSPRHAARAIDEIFRAFKLEWSGWRDVINDMRLRCAVLLLSASSVSITEAAHAAGYGSVTALGTALRNAQLQL